MDQSIIVTTKSEKKHILKALSKEKKLLNLKIYTFGELKKNLFFDYDNEAILYVMDKYHKNINIAKMYIENLYFLSDLNDPKIAFLRKLKDELDHEGLLKYNDRFREYLKNKEITIYGISQLSKEQMKILEGFNYSLKYDKNSVYMPLIYKAKDMMEEVEFVANRICKLLETVQENHIKVIASSEYTNVLHTYFKLFNIPINEHESSSFYSTLIAKEFLDNYDNFSIDANILLLSEKYSNVNDLITIINKSCLIDDKNKRLEFIIEDLKTTKIKGKRYDRGIDITSIDEVFDAEDYVFLLGFNMGVIPKVYQDNDYLSDTLKFKLGLDTSSDKNKLENASCLEKIKSIPNLVITYRASSERGRIYPSVLLELLGEEKEVFFDRSVSYSHACSNLNYAKRLDNLLKYNDYHEDLEIYQNSLDIPYRKYQNKFTGVNKKALVKHFNGELTLSYTSLEKYNECAFKFYVSKVLGLDIYEETFKIMLGVIAHHVLELGLKKEINIKEEIINFIKEKGYVLNSKEFFYLESLSEELEFVLKTLKEQEDNSSLKDYLFETELYVYFDRPDLKVTFKGFMDKVMYHKEDLEEVIAVVDYKTGDKNIGLDLLKYGLNLQLPIYLYLLKNSLRFKDAKIGGFYLQRILSPNPNRVLNKTLDEQKKDALKLNGYTNKNTRILKMMDKNYEDSKVIKGLKVSKNGELSNRAKVLSDEEMFDIVLATEKIINEGINNILNGEFLINPKVVNNKNIACQYCKFKDLCFASKENEVVLGGEDYELDKQSV